MKTKKVFLSFFTFAIIMTGALCFAGCAPNIQKVVDDIRFEVGDKYHAAVDNNVYAFYEAYEILVFNNSTTSKTFFPSDFSIDCRGNNVEDMEGIYFRLPHDSTSFKYFTLEPGDNKEIEVCFSKSSDEAKSAFIKYLDTYIAQVK